MSCPSFSIDYNFNPLFVEMLDCVEETERTMAMAMFVLTRCPSKERQLRPFIEVSTLSLKYMEMELVVMHVERGIVADNVRRGNLIYQPPVA